MSDVGDISSSVASLVFGLDDDDELLEELPFRGVELELSSDVGELALDLGSSGEDAERETDVVGLRNELSDSDSSPRVWVRLTECSDEMVVSLGSFESESHV